MPKIEICHVKGQRKFHAIHMVLFGICTKELIIHRYIFLIVKIMYHVQL